MLLRFALLLRQRGGEWERGARGKEGAGAAGVTLAGESSPLSMTEEQTLACSAKADRYSMRMMHVTHRGDG